MSSSSALRFSSIGLRLVAGASVGVCPQVDAVHGCDHLSSSSFVVPGWLKPAARAFSSVSNHTSALVTL